MHKGDVLSFLKIITIITKLLALGWQLYWMNLLLNELSICEQIFNSKTLIFTTCHKLRA